jgi:hypothetical protein
VKLTRFYALVFFPVLTFLVALTATTTARAQSPTRAPAAPAPEPQSVYADQFDPETASEDAGGNTGGVNFDMTFRYLTDYVYRGVDHSEDGGNEDAANYQFDTALSFDLGKAPHPYLGVFTNVYNSDPLSRFQEIRPFVGAVWTIRPLVMEAGHNTYLYPERDDQNTSEFYVRFSLDDSYWFKTEKPLFSPYLFGAYDYDTYRGWYIEMGVEHVIEIEDTGIGLRFFSDIAYVTTNQLYATEVNGADTGWQHYDVGMVASLNLNTATRLATRYGSWSIEGYLIYTDGIANELKADTQIWGGAGLRFRY